MLPPDQRRRVGIVIFENVEVLDFCGPLEVFSVVRLHPERRRSEPSPFEVMLIAETLAPVVTAAGMKVLPDHAFDTCPTLDILVVPGGWGVLKEHKNPVMLDWVRTRAAEVDTLTSVCTGAMILGFAGLLDGHRATTHFGSLKWMRESLPAVTVVQDQHVVEDGRIFSSAGISAGIDMSLRVVARFLGDSVARTTARHMEYPYPENNARRIEL